MDCKYIEEILVDYVEEFLDPQKRKLVDSHLAACSECSRKIDEYRSIKNVFKSEVLPEVSPTVMENLRNEAQRKTGTKTSFWKRWLYYPLLIPALSTAIALMVWINYRDNQKYNPDNSNIYSTEVMAKKDNQERPLESSSTTEQESVNKSEDIANDLVMADKPDNNNEPYDTNYRGDNDFRQKIPLESKKTDLEELPSTGNISDVKSKLVNRKKNTGETSVEQDSQRSGEKNELRPGRHMISESADDISEIEVSDHDVRNIGDIKATENLVITDNKYKIPEVVNPESKSVVTSKEDFKNIDESKLKKPEPPHLIVDKKYLDELNTALKKQQTGDCDTAIKINENLLQKSPEPSGNIKAQSYLSLAECYEQKNNYLKSIENYYLLKQVAPSKSSYAGKKIDELQIKINNTGGTGPSD